MTWGSLTSDFHADPPTGWGQPIDHKLEAVSPAGEVAVLNLDPLNESEVTRIVRFPPRD